MRICFSFVNLYLRRSLTLLPLSLGTAEEAEVVASSTSRLEVEGKTTEEAARPWGINRSYASSSSLPRSNILRGATLTFHDSSDGEEEMVDDNSIPSHPSSFAPFRGLDPMPIGPETSLRNPKVGIPVMEGALLHGDRVALSNDRPSLSQLAHDILADTASVSSCLYSCR